MTDEDNSTLHKLYPGIGIEHSEGAKICKELKSMEGTFVKKVQYSAFFGSKLHELLQLQKVDTVYLTGINTDYCIFASALDAFYLGYDTCLIQDACTSFNGSTGHQQGLDEFKKYLSDMGRILNTEEAIKEILKK